MRKAGPEVTGRGNGDGLSSPSPRETQEQGFPGLLEAVGHGCTEATQFVQRLNREDSLKKCRETKVQKCVREKER